MNGFAKLMRTMPDEFRHILWRYISDEEVEAARRPFLAPEKNPDAVALGRRGGLKGGRAAAQKRTPEQRSAIAQKASLARWKKARTPERKDP